MNIYYEDLDFEYEVDEDDLEKAKKKILKTFSKEELVAIIMELDQCVDEPLENCDDHIIECLEEMFYEKAKAEKEEEDASLFEERLYIDKLGF